MTDKFDVGASWKQGNSFAYVSSTDYDWENGTYWHSGRLLYSPSSAPTCDVVWGKDEEEDYDQQDDQDANLFDKQKFQIISIVNRINIMTRKMKKNEK